MAYYSLGKKPLLIYHNVRGLNALKKRSQLLNELNKMKPGVVFLQETHFKTGHIPNIHSKYFTKMFHATNNLAKTKEVFILISREGNISITDQLIDPGGRYIFLKGTWDKKSITLANVYFPNSAHITFCKHLIDELKGFPSRSLVLGGEFNIPLNPLWDTFNGKTCISYRVLKKIKTLLHSLLLVDTWRMLNPNGRDFTC